MPDVDNREYAAVRDAVAETRARVVGRPYVLLAANSASRIQEIRGLGFTESDATWLASLPAKTLDAILPTADGIAIAREGGMADLGPMCRFLAAQQNPPISVPADFGREADAKDAPAAVRVG